MARRRGRFERNMNRAEHAYKSARRGVRKVKSNLRGIRRRLNRPGSGLGQYTGWW